jgi:hypothetical protein
MAETLSSGTRWKFSFDSLAVFTAFALVLLVKLGALKRIPW